MRLFDNRNLHDSEQWLLDNVSRLYEQHMVSHPIVATESTLRAFAERQRENQLMREKLMAEAQDEPPCQVHWDAMAAEEVGKPLTGEL